MKKVAIGTIVLAFGVGIYFLSSSDLIVKDIVSSKLQSKPVSVNGKINHGDLIFKDQRQAESQSQANDKKFRPLNSEERAEVFTTILSLQSGVALSDNDSNELVQILAKYGNRVIDELGKEIKKGNLSHSKKAMAKRLSLIDALGKAAKSKPIAKEELYQFATSSLDSYFDFWK